MASRREFLAAGAAGLAGLWLPGMAAARGFRRRRCQPQGCAPAAKCCGGVRDGQACLNMCLQNEYAVINNVGYYNAFCCPNAPINCSTNPPHAHCNSPISNCTDCGHSVSGACISGSGLGVYDSRRACIGTYQEIPTSQGTLVEDPCIGATPIVDDEKVEYHLDMVDGGMVHNGIVDLNSNPQGITWAQPWTSFASDLSKDELRVKYDDIDPQTGNQVTRRLRLFHVYPTNPTPTDYRFIHVGQEVDPSDTTDPAQWDDMQTPPQITHWVRRRFISGVQAGYHRRVIAKKHGDPDTAYRTYHVMLIWR